MKVNVINEIVQNDLCIGCGVCAGLCPPKVLDMKFDETGIYIPVEKPGCLPRCTICLDACPFFSQEENEDSIGKNLFECESNINYRKETGYYKECFVGYSEVSKHRINGSSGGLATWLMEKMLHSNIVDFVVTVSPANEGNGLFKFDIYNDAASIRRSSGSVYYPVEMSEVIQTIVQKKAKYAVVGVPCFLKALRLSMAKYRKLNDRITVMIGLVCGQTKSKHYAEYLASRAGINGELKKIYFRGKNLSLPPNKFYFEAINQAKEKSRLYCDDGVSEAWVNRWFTPNACNYCDDVFAEVADVVLMDAWLPKYMKDSRGTSLALVRSQNIYNLFKQGISENIISTKIIPVDEIINSQRGVIEIKRKQLAYRLYLEKRKGSKLIRKRVFPSSKLDFFSKKEILIKNKMQQKTKKIFSSYMEYNIVDWEGISSEMSKELSELRKYQRIKQMLTLPARALIKLIKIARIGKI